jgi:hypothetical protein
MSPSGRSVEEDISRIMEKIIDCGILDSSPSMSRASKTVQHTVKYAVDDGWNTEDDNEELLAAINSCGILQSSLNHRIEHKRPRGRPKKKAIKRESIDHQPLHGHERISGAGTHHKQMFATHEVDSTQTLQPNRGRKHIIHATSAACGILNESEAANGRAVTVTKQPNDARRQLGHSATIRQRDRRMLELMDVDGQGETHNLGHDVEREVMHTINCRPQWDGK